MVVWFRRFIVLNSDSGGTQSNHGTESNKQARHGGRVGRPCRIRGKLCNVVDIVYSEVPKSLCFATV